MEAKNREKNKDQEKKMGDEEASSPGR